MSEETKLKGLGGWLIVVGIALIIAPLRAMAETIPVYLNMFSDGSWSQLTTPEGLAYHPLWAPVIIGELVTNVILIGIWISCAVMFFKKSPRFPKWFIGMLLAAPIYICIDAMAILLVMPDEPVFDPETVKEMVSSIVPACVWIPYMLSSKRVKATFAEKEIQPAIVQ